MARKAGRPKQPTEARKQLIHHARELFTVMTYEKVSTRLIAQKAGVNSALIRYYFGNKEGLFETMLRETLAPIQAQLSSLAQQSDSQHLSELMRTYYREMGKVPKFPRLIWQVMNLPVSETQRQLMEKVFADISQPMQAAVFNSLSQQGVLRSDADPQMSRISFLSLMVFPFLAPTSMLAIHGVELDEAFLTRLADHNLALFDPWSIGALSGRARGPLSLNYKVNVIALSPALSSVMVSERAARRHNEIAGHDDQANRAIRFGFV